MRSNEKMFTTTSLQSTIESGTIHVRRCVDCKIREPPRHVAAPWRQSTLKQHAWMCRHVRLCPVQRHEGGAFALEIHI